MHPPHATVAENMSTVRHIIFHVRFFLDVSHTIAAVDPERKLRHFQLFWKQTTNHYKTSMALARNLSCDPAPPCMTYGYPGEKV